MSAEDIERYSEWLAAELEGRAAAPLEPEGAAELLDQLSADHWLRVDARSEPSESLAPRVLAAMRRRRSQRRSLLAAGLAAIAALGLTWSVVVRGPRLAADCQLSPLPGAQVTVLGSRTVQLLSGELRLAVEGREPLTVITPSGTLVADGHSAATVGSYLTGDESMTPLRRLRVLVLAGAVLLSTPLGQIRGLSGELLAGEPDEAPKRLVRSYTTFALNLHRTQAARTPNDNVVLAPHSLASALALAYTGARGETARELATLLCLPAEPGQAVPWDAARLAAAHGALDTAMQAEAPEAARVRSAVALWADSALGLRPGLIGDLRRQRAGVFRTDFAGKPEDGLAEINGWVARATEQGIPQLLHPGDISANTRTVLTSAVHFRGHWARWFDRDQTRPGTFTRPDGTQIKVPMMGYANADTFAHGRFDAQARPIDWDRPADDGFTAVELPYEGARFALLVLVPERASGLPALEATLDEQALERVVGGLRSSACAVSLPKLDLRLRADLRPALETLGLRLLFRTEADLSGFFDAASYREPTRASAVIHAAYLRADERGTEAGGATAIVMEGSRRHVVEAHHAFMFVLRDRQHGSALFMGRVVDPTRP